jgi:hypothetical protein
MLTHRACAAATALLVAALLRAEPPDEALARAEKLLQEQRVGTDGAELVAFFRARTPTDKLRFHLADLVKKLGDEDFAVREKASADLIAAGRPALPLLRAAAEDADVERARRAAQCLQAIDAGADAMLTAAAARVLAERRPDGAVPALLAYVPFADDEHSEAAVLDALAVVGLRQGRPEAALLAALDDKDPGRRAAAAFVVGKAAPGEKLRLRPLLKDADARVRLRAASALAQAGDKAAVPTLIGLLSDGPLSTGWQALDLLGRIAGEKAPQATLGEDAEGRRKARDAWAGWWKDAADSTDLARVDFGAALKGINLICMATNNGAAEDGEVFECRADGRPTWRLEKLRAPSDVQPLPGGRLLLAEFQGYQVTERDRGGKVLWAHKVNAYPTTCQRLRNGNTFIATYSEVLEVTPDGKEAKKYASQGGSIYRAQRLPDGHVLFLMSGGQIVELDDNYKVVRNIAVPGGEGTYGGVELLPNGRYLVALYGSNKVLELDAAGKVHWEAAVTTASSATRLANGNTLVSSMDAKEVLELDRAGKVVHKITCTSRPFVIRRY